MESNKKWNAFLTLKTVELLDRCFKKFAYSTQNGSISIAARASGALAGTFLLFASNHCLAAVKCTSALRPEVQRSGVPLLEKQQPTLVKIKGSQVPFYNRLIAQRMRSIGDKPDVPALTELVQILLKNDTFSLPLTQEGLVPAANNGNHHGGYGNYIWLRDLARVSVGISSLHTLLNLAHVQDSQSASAVSRLNPAMIKLFTEENQMIRTLQNILDPDLHNDPENGYRNVIFVRLGLEARKDGHKMSASDIEAESKWGHKQNDALALYAHSLLDGLAKGEIRGSQITLEMKAELIYLVCYFQRVGFATMQDVGAWEEQMGLRTSSIGLVISFLERFQNGWRNQNSSSSISEKNFFRDLRSSWRAGKIRSQLESFMGEHQDSFKTSSSLAWNQLNSSLFDLQKSIDEAYPLLYKRLGISLLANGNRVYSELTEVDGNHETRGADAAILHLALYPPQKLTLEDRVHIVEQLKEKLMRQSGFARYSKDWFLYGGPSSIEFAGRLPIDPDRIAVLRSGAYRDSTLADRDRIYMEFQKQKYAKDMTKIIAEMGPDLESQWSFQDSMLVQIYVRFYKETNDPAHLDMAWFHLARALGWITGVQQYNIEGTIVESFKAPEAWIPVRLMNDNQQFNTYFFASPNSPLNWTTAELITGLTDFLRILNANRPKPHLDAPF